MRLDKFLKVSRLVKRRTVAREMCDAGRVTRNGRVARASAEVHPGDVLEITFGSHELRVRVIAVKENIPVREADTLYERLDPRCPGAQGAPGAPDGGLS